MNHTLYINGDDIRTEYGAASVQGNVARMLTLPKFKPLKVNRWREGTGHEADLSTQPVFASRDFTLRLAGSGVRDVAEAMMSGEYNEIACAGTPISFVKCRLRGVTSFGILNGMETADLQISSDDDPRTALSAYAAYMPAVTGPEPSAANRVGIAVPGQSKNWQYFDELGVRVLSGFASSALSPEIPKSGMLRNVSTVAGMIFDSSTANSNNRDADRTLQLPLLLHFGTNPQDFWSRLGTLLYWLTFGEVRVGESLTGSTYLRCYYDSMSVQEYMPSKTVPWIRFTVNLKVMNL